MLEQVIAAAMGVALDAAVLRGDGAGGRRWAFATPRMSTPRPWWPLDWSICLMD